MTNLAAGPSDQGKYEQAEESIDEHSADEREQPGVSTEGSGQVRGGGRDASTSARAVCETVLGKSIHPR
jgi:hypothetical protein